MTEMGINWRTSSYSNNGTCVEVADLPDGSRLVRDTKDNGCGSILKYNAAEWRAFVDGVKAGEFD
jgi:uncharacterized protein YeaC (DUF1315 family)